MRILIADFDARRSGALTDACQTRGFVIDRVRHGAAALQAALEAPPDVAIAPIDLPVIDAVRLSEILRGNPRLRHVSFLFLVKDDLDAPMGMDPRDGTVSSPWREADVLDHLDAILERTARFGGMRPESEIEGKLSQISVVDLLQMFQMNRKTGTLRIWQDGTSATGSIPIRDGRVLDASIPLRDGTDVGGEKALYRLFTWRDGRFEFVPGVIAEGGRIERPGRALLLEGMRQIDEWRRLRDQLPADSERLVLKGPVDEIPSSESFLTREVIDAVEAYGVVREIVDHCSSPDYQVLRGLADLLRRGTVEPDSQGVLASEGGGISLFGASALRRLRDWAVAARPRQGSLLKVVVSSAERERVRELYGALRESPEFLVDPRLLRDPERVGEAGSLGHVPLGEGLTLRLVSVPAAEEYAPLWEVAAHGMLGGIVLPTGPYGPALEETESVFQVLQRACPRPIVQLLVAGTADQPLPPAARSQIGSLEGGNVLVLPAASEGNRTPALRSVFERIVP